MLEGALVVLADERADLLRLQVVRVVVASAQHVGAQHDAPFDLCAEALRDASARTSPANRRAWSARIARRHVPMRRLESRIARRRTARGSSSLPRWPPGNRRESPRRRTEARRRRVVAPRSRSPSRATLKAADTSASTPSSTSARGTPMVSVRGSPFRAAA